MLTSSESLQNRILAARREITADLVLKKGRVVNVFSGSIQEKDVAVYDGIIIGTGSGYKGKKEVELEGKWVIPGLIDAHIHVESSMLSPSNLAAALLMHGTTAIISDPHEIANVMGLEGINFMLEDSRSIPFDVYFMAPSCVPATALETSGAELGVSDLEELYNEPRILGLAEMMNFPGVLMGDLKVIDKIRLFQNKVLDGHCPLLSGYDLQAYISAGIRSDHESTVLSEGLEKVENGMMLMIREGTSAKNLKELLPLVNSTNYRRFCFVSDDLHAEDLNKRGHLDFVLKKAVQLGLDPLTAVRLATINPSEYFGLKDRGAIAQGYIADIVVLDDLNRFEVKSVYKNGNMVVDSGKLISFPRKENELFSLKPKPLNIFHLNKESFKIPDKGCEARVIEIIPGQLITRMRFERPNSKNGFVVSDIDADILKLCVVERHKATGNIGLGLVRGFGLKRGAVASSVAHDSHNVIAAGVTDDDIFHAVDRVRLMGGGIAAVCNSETLAEVPLEIAGLMSCQHIESLLKQLGTIREAVAFLGCEIEDPFMVLSFLALPVIPELKLTDKGLVDVNRFEVVPLFNLPA
ncbi:MAG: adenine deaminase [Deltaproteobacteria bacterium]|nr:adenine deaminase [Deltaproteobacteria bacterium]